MTSSSVVAGPRVPLPVRCLLTVLALFAMVALAWLAGAGVAAVLGADAPQVVSSVVVGGVAIAVALALAVALARFVDRRPPGQLQLGLDRRTPLWVLAGMGAAAVAGTVAALATLPIGAAAPSTVDWGPAVAAQIPTMLAVAFLVQGIPEEILFRGYLVRTSGDRLPVWGVVVLSSVLFGSLHILSNSGATAFTQQLVYVAMAIGLGALATAARLASGSVWAAVGVHGGFHVTNFGLAVWLVPVQAAYGSYLALLAAAQLLAATAILTAAVRSGRLAWREPLPQPPAMPSAAARGRG